MFRPDKDSLPRWYGNLKEYKLTFAGANTPTDTSDDVYSLYLTRCAIDKRSSGQYSHRQFNTDTLSFWTTPIRPRQQM